MTTTHRTPGGSSWPGQRAAGVSSSLSPAAPQNTTDGQSRLHTGVSGAGEASQPASPARNTVQPSSTRAPDVEQGAGRLRVLVACECSGRVRDAFRALGHDAISCDMEPSETPGPHHRGNVLPLLREPWDLVIAHPPCDYLANSGVRWRVEREEWREVAEGVAFFMACLAANAPAVAVENPVMHGHASKLGPGAPSFTVQPWHFGDLFTKRTCFWTRGLPDLVPDFGAPTGPINAACHREAPGPNRKRNRSRTYPGIAAAMASQWGGFLTSTNPARAQGGVSPVCSSQAGTSRHPRPECGEGAGLSGEGRDA